MSNWANYDIESRLRAILSEVQYEHHFGGRPFLTAYQLAIEFANRHPADFAAIGLPIGGTNTGQPNSLTQYIAGQLSQRINAGTITDIEGSFLAHMNLHDITFDSPDGVISSSLKGSQYPVSMYRLRDTSPALT
ncbi:MAG: hypothetical protein QM758_14800 [Armatimonas sp.]